MKRKNLKNSSSSFEFPLKLSSLEYHLDSRSLAENHRISCGRAGNKACRRCVLRVPLTDSFFSPPFFFFFLPSPSFSYFSLPTNTCCTRHRGREIDFAAPDIRRQGKGVILRFSIAACSPLFTADSFHSKSCPSFQPPSKTESRPPTSASRFRFFGLSMPSWPRGRREFR